MPCWGPEQCAVAERRWNASIGLVTYTHDLAEGWLPTKDLKVLMSVAASLGLCEYRQRVYVDGKDTAIDIGLEFPSAPMAKFFTGRGVVGWDDKRLTFVPRVWPRVPISVVSESDAKDSKPHAS